MAKETEVGYNYKFTTEPPDSLKCLICLSVVKEPQQHAGCGKLFCKVCIDHYKLQPRNDNPYVLLQPKNIDCPHCRQPLADWRGISNLFYDLKSEQEVNSLLANCLTQCGWTGELRDIEGHKEKDCPNTLIPCPRGCHNGKTKIVRRNKDYHLKYKCSNRPYSCEKCKTEMEFRNATNHALSECPKRQYTCPHCHKAGVYDKLTTTHLTVCPKVKVECSKCSTKILRCDKSAHSKVCEYEPVKCMYYNIGCGEKPLRKDLLEHEENVQLHLSIATKEVLRLNNVLHLKNTLSFKMKNFKGNKSNNACIYGSSFFTSTNGCPLVAADGIDDGAGTHVTIAACLMKGDHDDTLIWPFTGSVTVELLNQLEDKNHHKKTFTFPADNEISKRVMDGKRGKAWGWNEFISHAALDYNASTNTQYLKDDTLVFRVSAEAPDHKPWLECAHTV